MANTEVDLTSFNTDQSSVANLDVQRKLADTFHRLSPSTHVSIAESIEEAIGLITRLEKPTVFVTGSLHLVGGVLTLFGEDA